MKNDNFLFTPGPTPVPNRIQHAMLRPLEDHRSASFPKLLHPLLKDIKALFRTESGHVLIYPGSGTVGWEAALTNTLSPGDKVLIPIYGEFGKRWADLAAKHKLDVEPLILPWGECAPVAVIHERLQKDINMKIKAVFIVHNETSTGVVSNIPLVRKAINDAMHPALLFVDGVSSIGGIEFNMEKWGVDLAICGSQKCLMLPPGLTLIGVSKKALKQSKMSQYNKAYFDFKEMIQANQTGYFPFTPPLTLFYGLRESVTMLLKEGLDNVWIRHKRIACAVQRAVNVWNLDLCSKDPNTYSNTVSTIITPERFDTNTLIKTAYDKYHLSLGGGLSQLNGKAFRIGHMGYVEPLTLAGVLTCIENCMNINGIKIQIGSGASAALHSLDGAALTEQSKSKQSAIYKYS